MLYKSIIFVLLISLLLIVGCKKTPSGESERINIGVSTTVLFAGDTLIIDYELCAKNAGFLWYRIETSPPKRGSRYYDGICCWCSEDFKVFMNSVGRFEVQAFLGNNNYDESSARVSSNIVNITVTGTVQNYVNISSPVDSQIYCVNKPIAFKAQTNPSSSDWIDWYDNSIYLGQSQSGEIAWFTLNYTGVHDIEAEWSTKGVSSHVGIYVGNPFTFEYDHQQSWDVFKYGTGAVENAFKYGNTFLDIKYDADTLIDLCVRFDSLFYYYLKHVQTDGHGNTLYPGYLCGIQAFIDSTYVIDTLWGWTRPKVYSFVCVPLADEYDALNGVAIHELGHLRADLSELCLDYITMNPAHNDGSCVMGTMPVAICSGENVAQNPHFCPACCDSLKNVTW